MTLTQAKDQIAQQHDFDTWAEMDKAMNESDNLFHPLNDYERWQDLHTESAKLYASEKVKEALKVAAERAETKMSDEFGLYWVDKQSILSLETELVNNIKNEK